MTRSRALALLGDRDAKSGVGVADLMRALEIRPPPETLTTPTWRARRFAT